jgi:hypothetical protein
MTELEQITQRIIDTQDRMIERMDSMIKKLDNILEEINSSKNEDASVYVKHDNY